MFVIVGYMSLEGATKSLLADADKAMTVATTGDRRGRAIAVEQPAPTVCRALRFRAGPENQCRDVAGLAPGASRLFDRS